MTRSGRDVLFGLLGVVIVLGILVVVSQFLGDDDVAPSQATGDTLSPGTGPDDAPELTIASSDTTSASTTTTATTTMAVTTTVSTIAEAISIASIQSTELELWEDAAACSERPRTAVVTANVVGTNEIVGVVLGWAVDGPEFEMEWVEMAETDPGIYSFEVGPFDSDSVAVGSAEAILLAVEAADVADEVAYDDSSLVLLLFDCEVGS